MNLETVFTDSVVYEPSREEIPVSEGPGMDFNVDSGPEMPFVVFVDRLNMPGGNFAGVGPVEPSPVLPNTSNPPVPIGVVVSGSNSPIPVFRLLLELSDLSSDIVFRRPRISSQSRISLGMAGLHRNDPAGTRRVPAGSGRLRACPSRVGELHAITGNTMYRIRDIFVGI